MAGMNLTVYALDGVVPVVDPTAFVHPSAVLIGDVIVGPGCYIGPAACLRGDFGHIEIRAGANIQDTCVLHGYPGLGTIVEEDGHVGHGAVLHGCRVERNGLVGMNAVVNDNAVVGDSAIVAAMAFVKAGMVIPPRTIAAGVPAKVLRALTDTELAWKAEGTRHYQDLARRSVATMQAVAPLPGPEPGRKRRALPEMLPLSVLKGRTRG
mgnify:FL=1